MKTRRPRPLHPGVRPQGAAGARPDPRQVGGRGARHPAVHAPKAAARLIEKVLRSAMANAEHNHQVRNLDDLRVVKAVADGGPSHEARVRRGRWAARSSSSTGRAISPSSVSRRDAARAARVAAAPGAQARQEVAMGQKTHPIGFRLGIHAHVELALVRHQGLRGPAARGREDPPLHQVRSSTTRASRGSTSSARPTARASRSSRRGPASSSAARAPRWRSSRTRSRCGRGKEVYLNIEEVVHPELDAQLVAENVALQLQKRVAFRRAMKKAVTSALRLGADGIRIACAGRLGGARDRAPRVVPRRPGAAAHHPRRHRLRPRRGAHDLRDHRREGVDLQGRGAPRPAGRRLRAESPC